MIQTNYFELLRDGREEQAYELLSLAAEEKDPLALFNLGVCHYIGIRKKILCLMT